LLEAGKQGFELLGSRGEALRLRAVRAAKLI
jgi:hypothetical protein